MANAAAAPHSPEQHPGRPGVSTDPHTPPGGSPETHHEATTDQAPVAADAQHAEPEAAEVFVPRTERSHWVDIADALNAAHAAGMPVGIDLDGTLTDHRAWSVVWDRNAEQWTVAGYEDDNKAQAEAGTGQCGHDDYHDPHEWADRPGVWCPGHSFDEPVPVIGDARLINRKETGR
jgi:hypothetical protein